jgi:hypothetical protein
VDTDLLREVNRRIYEVTRGFEEPSEFVCECGQDGCQEKLMLRTAEFIEILTAPKSLVAPEHMPRASEALGARGGSPLPARIATSHPKIPSAKSPRFS